MQQSLDKFLTKSVDELINLCEITLKDVIRMLRDGTFDKYFDRKRIIKYLWYIGENIKKYSRREYCPRCGSSKVKMVPNYEGAKPYFECRVCRKRFVHRPLVQTHFSDWVIEELVEGVYSGKPMKKIIRDIERHADEDLKDKIPDEKTLYDLLDRVAAFLSDFDIFLVLLCGGLKSNRLMFDDAFSRRRGHRKRCKQKSIGGNIVVSRGKSRRRKFKRYYYTIVVLDPDLRCIVAGHASDKRDRIAFSIAFMMAREKMSRLPLLVKGDKLRAMVEAAEEWFPKNQVKHEFEKLSKYEKKELNKIENRIRKLRETIGKRRKYGSLNVLRNYLTIAIIGTNYLERIKILGNRAPMEVVGVPYPKPNRWGWRYFLQYARIVRIMLPYILKASLKTIPGTMLKPILPEKFIQ